MQFGNLLIRAAGAACLLAASGMNGPATAATPPLIWQDVERVQLLCLATGESGVDSALQDRICAAARAIAAEDAPAPVETIAIGDPAVLGHGRVTLLIHASVSGVAEGRLLAFSVRPYRVSAEQDSVLFGAAPRAVLLPEDGADALEPALREALSEILPWRSPPRGPRPIGR